MPISDLEKHECLGSDFLIFLSGFHSLNVGDTIHLNLNDDESYIEQLVPLAALEDARFDIEYILNSSPVILHKCCIRNISVDSPHCLFDLYDQQGQLLQTVSSKKLAGTKSHKLTFTRVS